MKLLGGQGFTVRAQQEVSRTLPCGKRILGPRSARSSCFPYFGQVLWKTESEGQWDSERCNLTVVNDGTGSVDDFCADFSDYFQSKLKASGTAGCLKVTVMMNDKDGGRWFLPPCSKMSSSWRKSLFDWAHRLHHKVVRKVTEPSMESSTAELLRSLLLEG